ncbi:MAG: hypothetical protein A2Y67_03495 [Candidatus Buchananbacteria bacterium RBG_13_39_9]|uniref:Cell division protein FtsL n=1 Tax=Candidatus Buchananbacteria bacterium RBG_13_39_9 TaxID=1797531 RepID=A0A1G1XSB8_9BACT|nr:MAG: hypothetical protein A2Y67_03495 [Candidatus Buchananbacteria bacterium RBG_13_39_9]
MSNLDTQWSNFKQRLFAEDNGQNYQNKNKNKVIILSVLIFICGIYYLCQINNMATKGYQINELENQTAELKQENKRLQVEITELRSITRLTEKVEELKMVEVSRIEYIKANGATVALNR